MVGEALKGSRDKIILSSKSPAKTGALALADLDTSLRTIGTDHLDIWYMHMKDKPEALSDDLVEAFESAKKQGKSPVHRHEHARRERHGGPRPADGQVGRGALHLQLHDGRQQGCGDCRSCATPASAWWR